jgi:hypothetical protein
MYVLLSIDPGQCLMSFLLSVTFFSGVYSVTLYFHGFNLKFSCVNLHLYNLKERFLTSLYSKKDQLYSIVFVLVLEGNFVTCRGTGKMSLKWNQRCSPGD